MSNLTHYLLLKLKHIRFRYRALTEIERVYEHKGILEPNQTSHFSRYFRPRIVSLVGHLLSPRALVPCRITDHQQCRCSTFPGKLYNHVPRNHMFLNHQLCPVMQKLDSSGQACVHGEPLPCNPTPAHVPRNFGTLFSQLACSPVCFQRFPITSPPST